MAKQKRVHVQATQYPDANSRNGKLWKWVKDKLPSWNSLLFRVGAIFFSALQQTESDGDVDQIKRKAIADFSLLLDEQIGGLPIPTTVLNSPAQQSVAEEEADEEDDDDLVFDQLDDD